MLYHKKQNPYKSLIYKGLYCLAVARRGIEPLCTMPAKVLAGSLPTNQNLLLCFFLLKNRSVILRATQKELMHSLWLFFFALQGIEPLCTMPAKVLAGSLPTKQNLLLCFFLLKNR